MIRYPGRRPALISIHDVAEGTLDKVSQILEYLTSVGIQETITLLVIPGGSWSSQGLDVLRRFQQQGCDLAGHGWIHKCLSPRTWYHRLHSVCLSRNVAEHLALDDSAIAALIRDCFAWFGDSRLTQPELYVPPAWAMGSISRSTLRDLPFRYYETLSGVYDKQRDLFRRIPLLGYEADTAFRSGFLRCLNGFTGLTAVCLNRPVRVSIHPHDLDLRLGRNLRQTLAQVEHAIGYSELCQGMGQGRVIV